MSKGNRWVKVEQSIAYDIWPHLSVLSYTTPEEISEILHNEFTPRQAKDLRRELGRLRRGYTKLLVNKLIEEK